jgi:hypothetical protein
VQIVFGARQTGKSTLLRELIPQPALRLDFSDPGLRSSFLSEPAQLIGICRAMPRTDVPSVVVIDEAQNVPAVFDAVQHLYDGDKTRWRFVLCGSSARKLRLLGTNLLPGRSMVSHLYPLTTAERPCTERATLSFTSASLVGVLTADASGVAIVSSAAVGSFATAAVGIKPIPFVCNQLSIAGATTSPSRSNRIARHVRPACNHTRSIDSMALLNCA